MIMSTLDTSSRVIFAAPKKISNGILEINQRGRHENIGRQVDNSVKESVRNHIRSFPSIPSHYCRTNTSRNHKNFNILLMHMLYLEKRIGEKVEYGKKKYV